MSKFDEAYDRLESWAKTLANHLNSNRKQIRDILDGKVKLPDGCPSRGSAAVMVLHEMQHDRDEIAAAIADLEEAIWKEGE